MKDGTSEIIKIRRNQAKQQKSIEINKVTFNYISEDFLLIYNDYY